VDTVIGALGQGGASESAYSFAVSVAKGLTAGNANSTALSGINSALLANYLTLLDAVQPRNYRLGSGKEQADGAVSYLARFIGKDKSVTGELYIRYITQETEGSGKWVFEELILEEVKNREDEINDSAHRYDFPPYERFF